VTKARTPQTIDEYIASCSPDVQATLEAIRRTIRKVLPGAEEAISYQIPTFRLDGGYVVYFAGWKKHVSLYPIPDADAELENELAPYKAGKGTLRFPLGKPIPHGLIERVVDLLARQRQERGRS
jgi:uncharacterized protein YdhG (YjbR/CyaY superfamily)